MTILITRDKLNLYGLALCVQKRRLLQHISLDVAFTINDNSRFAFYSNVLLRVSLNKHCVGSNWGAVCHRRKPRYLDLVLYVAGCDVRRCVWTACT